MLWNTHSKACSEDCNQMQTPAAAWQHSLVAPAVWLNAHRDNPYVGHFAKTQGAVALGSSKGREHTAKGLMMIHSDTQRESSVSACF